MQLLTRLPFEVLSATLMLLIPLTGVAAEAGRYDLTTRLNLVGANGKPTNDALGLGVSIHRQLSDDWFLGVNLDHSPSFDFERTASVVGITQDQSKKDIDAVGSMFMITVVAERRYRMGDDNWTGYWNLGGGFNQIDMDDVQGPVEGGGSFDIVTDIDTELVLVGGVGLMQQFGTQWSARYGLGFERHLADWKVRDKNSGNTGSIADYTIFGLRLGMNYQFQ